MLQSSESQLSLEQQQTALFKVLNKTLVELFDGKQKDLAAVLHVDQSTVSRWLSKKSVSLNPSAMGNDYQVLIALISIHRSLHAIFSAESDRQAWFKAKNTHLNESSPRDLAASGFDGLIKVRQYLDFMRGLGA